METKPELWCLSVTLGEVEGVIQQHKMDQYHRFLLQWCVDEIKRLTQETKVVEERLVHYMTTPFDLACGVNWLDNVGAKIERLVTCPVCKEYLKNESK